MGIDSLTSPAPHKLDPLRDHGHRKARRVVLEDGPHAEQLFNLAAGTRLEWTSPAWAELLKELDKCNDRVDDWRALRELK